MDAAPLDGTAVGSGLNTHPDFARRVRELLSARTGIETVAPVDRFKAQASRDALVEYSGVLKVIAVSLTKIANHIALLASGPRAGQLPAQRARSPHCTEPVGVDTHTVYCDDHLR
jgi:fumarate hydratase class II